MILLIPGLDGTGRLFEPQLPALSKRYRPMAWCFRRRDRFDFSDLVQELAEATSDEEPNSITVVGESFGGPVAIHYVLEHPGRVRALVLINSFCYYGKRLRVRMACLLSPLLQRSVVRDIKNRLGSGLLALEGVPLSGRRLYREVVDSVYLPSYRQRLELVCGLDLRHRLGEIGVTTRILAAGRDKIVPSISQGRLMAQSIPGARFHVFPRAGHALLLTPGFVLSDYV